MVLKRRQRYSESSPLQLNELKDYFVFPLHEAAQQLGMSVSLLKKICRKFGISKWPFRTIRRMQGTHESSSQFKMNSLMTSFYLPSINKMKPPTKSKKNDDSNPASPLIHYPTDYACVSTPMTLSNDKHKFEAETASEVGPTEPSLESGGSTSAFFRDEAQPESEMACGDVDTSVVTPSPQAETASPSSDPQTTIQNFSLVPESNQQVVGQYQLEVPSMQDPFILLPQALQAIRRPSSDFGAQQLLSGNVSHVEDKFTPLFCPFVVVGEQQLQQPQVPQQLQQLQQEEVVAGKEYTFEQGSEWNFKLEVEDLTSVQTFPTQPFFSDNLEELSLRLDVDEFFMCEDWQ